MLFRYAKRQCQLLSLALVGFQKKKRIVEGMALRQQIAVSETNRFIISDTISR